jgi:hypothetical protein
VDFVSTRPGLRPDVTSLLRLVSFALLALACVTLSRPAAAVPSYARQTGMPCSQCHTLSFGPALTAYGRQFKLNGYTFGEGEHPMPLALMVQGGYSRVDKSLPDPAAAHFATNNNLSVDQVSLFYGGRLSEHAGAFVQITYSGEDRHLSWDNLDVRYARPVKLFGTDAIVGLSINNNPTVQDLWNSTPAWGFPYISSPLVPGPGASPILSGALAQVALGATAYTMIHDHVYLEAGAYRGMSDHWLGNVGLYSDNNLHMEGAAPYWRAAYQFTHGDQHYFSFGAFGLDAKLQPDPTVLDSDRYTDVGVDATYQYTAGTGAILANASFTHEKEQYNATFAALGSNDDPNNHLNALLLDVSYAYRQTWSAGVGAFDIIGSKDVTLYGAGPFAGSRNASPTTSGYTLQFECVPLGKMESWGRPWVNLRLGVQYTGYVRFNGGGANYDGFGRAASQNNSLFLFSWMAF